MKRKVKLFLRLALPLVLALCVMSSICVPALAVDQVMVTARRTDEIDVYTDGDGWSIQFGSANGFDPTYKNGIILVFSIIKSEFQQCFGKESVRAASPLLIAHNDDSGPVTYRASDNPGQGVNLIYLSSNSGRYQQQIYQFSHELCHMMVPSGVESDFRWLEESFCELMSWTILDNINHHEDSFNQLARLYPGLDLHSSMRSYMNDSMEERVDLAGHSLPEVISINEDSLRTHPYLRDFNSAVAYELFPLFQEHPELWRIIPYLNKMDSQQTLRDALKRVTDLAQLPEATANLLIKRLCGEAQQAPAVMRKDIPVTGVAYASSQTVDLDGKKITLPAYALKDEKGYPTNYVRLRDFAALLDGTAAQFDVLWSNETGISVIPHQNYAHPNGTEGHIPFSGNQNYRAYLEDTLVGQTYQPLTAFRITFQGGGHTYYQLRDLGRALNFNVGWSSSRGIFIETDRPYTDAD